jgi:multimeric flavodoxin WrbA
MNILVILGSPRKGGNSETAATTVVNELDHQLNASREFVRLAALDVAPCIGCGGCEKTGECVVKDDMVDIYPKIDAADIIILAAPTYFYGLSAQIKACIDRIQARWSRKYLLRVKFRKDDLRKGYLICTAATRGKKLFDGSVLVAKSFFDAIDVDYGGALLVRGVDERGALRDNLEEIDRAQALAREIAAGYINRIPEAG